MVVGLLDRRHLALGRFHASAVGLDELQVLRGLAYQIAERGFDGLVRRRRRCGKTGAKQDGETYARVGCIWRAWFGSYP